jgi:hypothetical protein
MDYEKLSKEYYQQRKQNSLDEHLKYQKSVQQFPNGYENKGENFGNYKAPEPVEVDYAITHMPSGTYVVSRSNRLGSLNYQFICECTSQWQASEIVKALNK